MVVVCVYKHPNMSVLDFTSLINQLLDKVTKERKQFFFLEDFNINLLNYNEHQPTNEFLDYLVSNSITRYILQSTRLTSHFRTLIDNSFSTVHSFFMFQYLETLLQPCLIIHTSFFVCSQCTFKSFMK